MKNTGIVYPSTEKTPVILPEMENLFPPLSEEQMTALEADILKNGCYTHIIVDEKLVIVDGHHRQKICVEHDIPYTMLVFSFENMLEAKQWALDTQKNRRNLTAWELGNIALKLKPDMEARAKENMGTRTDLLTTLSEGSPSASSVNTRKELANAVGIGEVTMGKVMQIDEHGPEAVKEALDKKELSVNKGYNLTKQLQQLPEDQREQAAIDAVELEKAKQRIRKADAEIDSRAKVSSLFSKAYASAVRMVPTEDHVRAWVEFSCMDLTDMEDMIRQSRDLSARFSAVADILEQKIIPADWRCAHEQDPAESEG